MSVLLLLSDGASTSEALACAAWLLTYVVHTFVWAALAGLIIRFSAPRASRASVLWRLALFGPIATSFASVVRSQLLTGAVTSYVSDAPMEVSKHAESGLTVARYAVDSWISSTLTMLVIATASVGFLRFVVTVVRFARAIRGRTVVRDERLLARFTHMQRTTRLMRVALTESDRVGVPLVVGRREVCIPQHGLDAFSEGEVDAVFAHELAHLERGDGIWFPVIGLIESVLWVQPLNRWVAARCREAAELACDDRAVAWTRAPTQLARVIVHIAEQSRCAWRQPLSPAMASVSVPVQRVRRLLCPDGLQTSAERTTRALHASRWSLVGLALFGLASPSIRLERANLPISASAAVATGESAPFETPQERAHRLQRELDRLLHHASIGAQRPLTIAELRRSLRQLRTDDAQVAARFDPQEESARQQ